MKKIKNKIYIRLKQTKKKTSEKKLHHILLLFSHKEFAQYTHTHTNSTPDENCTVFNRTLLFHTVKYTLFNTAQALSRSCDVMVLLLLFSLFLAGLCLSNFIFPVIRCTYIAIRMRIYTFCNINQRVRIMKCHLDGSFVRHLNSIGVMRIQYRSHQFILPFQHLTE